jgi:hypothetical protein
MNQSFGCSAVEIALVVVTRSLHNLPHLPDRQQTADRDDSRRHTSCPRRPCRVRLGQPVAELPLEIPNAR